MPETLVRRQLKGRLRNTCCPARSQQQQQQRINKTHTFICQTTLLILQILFVPVGTLRRSILKPQSRHFQRNDQNFHKMNSYYPQPSPSESFERLKKWATKVRSAPSPPVSLSSVATVGHLGPQPRSSLAAQLNDSTQEPESRHRAT